MTTPINTVYDATVVRISTPVNNVSEAVGTGFCIKNDVTDDVIFLTNAHVVADGQLHNIEVAWAPGNLIPVEVAAIVYSRDIALIKCSKQVWEQNAKEYLKDKELEHILSVPTVKLGHDHMFQTNGTKCSCVGHPLGLKNQQVCKGITRGIIDMGDYGQRTLISNPINHGNSGGKCTTMVDGKEYVIGITTMKLSGKDVEAEGGIINIDTVRAALFHMKQELKPPQINMNDPRTMAALKQLLQKAGCNFPMEPLKNAQVKPSNVLWLSENYEEHASQWVEHAVAGRVNGDARPFAAWLLRHVYYNNELLENGASMLDYVLDRCSAGKYKELTEFSSQNKGWKAIRTGAVIPTMPNGMSIQVAKKTVSLHPPRHGLVGLQPVHNIPSYKTYYGCRNDERGAIVNTLMKTSLYKMAGGQEGDLIYAFQLNDTDITYLDKNGEFTKTGALGTRYSVSSMCNNIPWATETTCNTVRFLVKREGGENTDVTIQMRCPTPDEIPAMYKIMPFNNESDNAGAEVMGFKLVQVHKNHIEQLQLMEYADETRHYDFRLICVSHPPRGVKIPPGATLVSMNGVDAYTWNNMKDFCNAMDAMEKEMDEKKKRGEDVHFTAVFARSGGFKSRVIIKV